MKIGYWGIRGRAHPVRNLAHFLGLQFEDKRYSAPEEWFGKDKKELQIPFPNLPYIVDGDVKLSESKALLKYLCVKAKKEEMLGKTLMDQIYIEQVAGVFSDFAQAIYTIITTTDDIPTYEKTFNEKIFPKLEEFNKFFEKKKFIGGDELTWADFEACELLEFAQTVSSASIKVNLFEKYKNVDKYYKTFQELPKVKEFFSKEENRVPFLPPTYVKIKL